MGLYSYFDYLENYYEDYYDYYYEYIKWPTYYNGTNYTGTYPPSQYEYAETPAMEYITPPLYAFILLMAIVSIVIVVYVYYRVIAEQCQKTQEIEVNKAVLVLTLFCLSVHLLQNLTSPILYYYMWISFDVKAYKVLMVWDMWWCATRISIYALFVYRFFLIFRAQEIIYSISNCYKRTLFALFALIMSVQCSFYIFYMIVFYSEEMGNVYTDSTFSRSWKNVYWAFLALDICFIALMGFLVSKSILTMIADMDNLKISKKTTIITSGTSGSNKIECELADYVGSTADIDGSSDLELEVSASSADNETMRIRTEVGSDLVMVATKIALLICVSMISSFLYQFIWMLSYEFGNFHLLLFSYTWSLDGVTNMICIYLSMGLATKHYDKFCIGFCKCHQCALRCIKKVSNVQN